jgi:hypothetical protein
MANKLFDQKVIDKAIKKAGGVDEDAGYSASSASENLEDVRALFYGTPIEKVLDEVIGLCDQIADLAERSDD